MILALCPSHNAAIPDYTLALDTIAADSAGQYGGVRWKVESRVAYIGASGFCVPNSYGLHLGIVADLVEQFARDPSVNATLIQMETPGGYVAFCERANAAIGEHAAVKPIHAISETMTCSAGYWAIARASKILAVRGAVVGSVGVLSRVVSYAQMMEKAGIKSYTFATGPYKGIGMRDEDLTDEQKDYMQEQLNTTFAAFKSGLSSRVLSNAVMLGGVFSNDDALRAGLVDSFTNSARAHYAALQFTFGR